MIRNFKWTLQCKFIACIVIVGLLSGCTSTEFRSQSASVTDSREVRQLAIEAVQTYESGDYANAELLFQEMMAHEPRSPEVLNGYAICLREQWKLEEAEKIYLKALQFSPEDSMSHWNIAVLYDLYLGVPEKALTHYQTYQRLTEKPDRRVHGWVVDLQHRIKQKAQEDKTVEVAGNE